MSRLTYHSHRSDDMVRLALAGEFDLSNAAQVEDALKEIERERPTLLVLDLRELTFMDSTGLRVMVSADARARDDSRRLAVVQGPESVRGPDQCPSSRINTTVLATRSCRIRWPRTRQRLSVRGQGSSSWSRH